MQGTKKQNATAIERNGNMSQLKDERRMKEIFVRGAPYPWDFWESSESGFAGQDYETYWRELESRRKWQDIFDRDEQDLH